MKAFSIPLVLEFLAEDHEDALAFARHAVEKFQSHLCDASIEMDELTLNDKSVHAINQELEISTDKFPDVWW